MMEQKEHSFYVETLNNGFRIYSKDEKRKGSIYHLDKYGFWIGEHHPYKEIPLYAFRNLIDFVIEDIYNDWEPPEKYRESEIKWKIKTWAKNITGKTLNHLILNSWKDNIQRLDPIIEQLHRKLFSISVGKGYFQNIKKLLDSNNKYLISDVLNYRAARIALLWNWNFDPDKDWMISYSYTGEKYTSLTKTLMHIPANIISPSLLYLKEIFLPEPVINRFRLMAYISLLTSSYNFNERRNENEKAIILRSSDQDIIDALKYMRHYFPSEKSKNFRSSMEMMKTFNMIFDYPASWENIDILGLSKRSELYHWDIELQRRIQEQEMERRRQQYEKEVEIIRQSNTALPKIALPQDEHIKFLDSFKAVEKEGDLMKHCIATYAENAVKGDCYLFHVDYNGEMASVEVSPKGFVRQSYGPRDSDNSASRYGQKFLSEWAKGLQ